MGCLRRFVGVRVNWCEYSPVQDWPGISARESVVVRHSVLAVRAGLSPWSNAVLPDRQIVRLLGVASVQLWEGGRA